MSAYQIAVIAAALMAAIPLTFALYLLRRTRLAEAILWFEFFVLFLLMLAFISIR